MGPEHKVSPEELELYSEEGCEPYLSHVVLGRRDTEFSWVLIVDRDKFLRHQVFWHMVIISTFGRLRQENPGI